MEPRNATVTLSLETDVKRQRLPRAEFWQRIVDLAVDADPNLLGGGTLIVRGARVDVIQPVKRKRARSGLSPGKGGAAR